MSSQNQDLRALLELLEPNLQQQTHQLSDQKLLEKILLSLNQQQSKWTQQLDDSLAFPQKTRQQLKLQQHQSIWDKLKQFDHILKQDHQCRRQLLLSRLDCTVESFKWKSSSQSQLEQQGSLNQMIHDKYEPVRATLREEPQVGLDKLLAVRQSKLDQLLNQVSSSRPLDCQVQYNEAQKNKLVNLKQIIIPKVPDRGGRPEDVRAPRRETFAQQSRTRGRH